MVSRIKRDNVAIVLVGPRIPENIGAVARAMNNMGIGRLILVKPANMDLERIARMATSHSTDVIENMKVFDDLGEALAPFEYIAGTTARIGSMRPALSTPKDLAKVLVSISEENDIAILFGPEDRGLSNDHMSFCHTIINIPTSEFSSLNLAQAVMIVCYELFQATGEGQEIKTPRLANSFELEGMYDHLEEVLTRIGFINPQNPERWMWNIRRLFSRLPLQASEVRIMRGICRQIDWYVDQEVKRSKDS